MKMRLDRWLATLSVGSRSEVKQWIRGGQAAVNGRVIRDPALSFETEQDSLTLNGKALDGRVVRHVMLHKPARLLTAARDAKQPTVMDLLPPVYRSIGSATGHWRKVNWKRRILRPLLPVWIWEISLPSPRS